MKYYLSLGGNLGDTRTIFQGALARIGQTVGTVERVSSFYRTAPWGFEAPSDFLNAAAVVESSLPPEEVLNSAGCAPGRGRGTPRVPWTWTSSLSRTG